MVKEARFVVHIYEYERGWGSRLSRLFDTRYFAPTEEGEQEALSFVEDYNLRVKDYNRRPDGGMPNYYFTAEQPKLRLVEDPPPLIEYPPCFICGEPCGNPNGCHYQCSAESGYGRYLEERERF